MNVDDLTAPERRLWEAFPRGETVDLGADDPAGPSGPWGPERLIRAEVLVALLAGAVESEPGQVAALRLNGARITGSLNLGHAQVSAPLALSGCVFDTNPYLYWATMSSIHLMDCRLPGLVASGLRVDGHLWLQGSRFDGGLFLDGAHISGILNMSGVQLSSPGGDALLADRLAVDANVYLDQGFSAHGEVRLPGARVGGQLIIRQARLHNPGGSALYASRLDVAANVFCDGGFVATGAVRLRGARVGGYLSFVGAKISNPGKVALSADDLAVETDVYCSDGFTAEGTVSFAGANVTGQLKLDRSRLRCENGTALSLQHLQAEEVVLRPAEIPDGTVDLSYARIGLLRDSAGTWPRRLQLDGLQYENLEPALTARERLDWLRRDTDGYQPQPYERLAQTYRALGLDADGRSVLLAKARDRRRSQGLPRKIVGWMQDVLVGYGYRPFRAASWLGGLLAFGTIVFSLHKPAVLDDGHHPHFNAFLYTLDLLLPIGTLGQEVEYAPQGVYQWIANLLVVAGLLLGLTVAAGATRALSRE
ncbi:hypothetical protein [Actinomadura parmotrematis]|uniref:Oxidoreductase n=1 Tax=Actinomadura parmotrematis TaxID=2864039 RepID=A0ABS7FNV2_9ACTN|nr:hypothetical protein [Actinomadura parmotrematis]MBW8482057.1 hypothetical protein [Actinomadura parmotrematis]